MAHGACNYCGNAHEECGCEEMVKNAIQLIFHELYEGQSDESRMADWNRGHEQFRCHSGKFSDEQIGKWIVDYIKGKRQ